MNVPVVMMSGGSHDTMCGIEEVPGANHVI